MDIHSNTLVGTVNQCHELQTGSKFRTIANEQNSLDSDKIKTNSSLTESGKLQVSNLLSKFSSMFSQSESLQ